MDENEVMTTEELAEDMPPAPDYDPEEWERKRKRNGKRSSLRTKRRQISAKKVRGSSQNTTNCLQICSLK